MAFQKNIKDIFHMIIKDRKIIFLIIASLLITLSTFAYYNLSQYYDSFYTSLIVGICYSFSWVIVAWIITDISILRKIYPYIAVFFLLFLDKIYWNIFYYLYPPISFEKLSTLSDFSFLDEYQITYDYAYYFFIFVKFIVFFFVFLIFWYLSKPRDFKDKLLFLKKKNMAYVIFASFFMSMTLFLSRLITTILGNDFIYSLSKDFMSRSLYYFSVNAIPFVIGLLIFSVIITNIKTIEKYVLYVLIIVFSLIYLIPLYNFGLWTYSQNMLLTAIYFIIHGISYFVIFLSFLLLSKTKYIEQ